MRIAGAAWDVAERALAPFRALGTLAVGAEADIAVLDSRDGDFEFVDNERAVRRRRQKLVPAAVVLRGRLVT